MRKIFTVIIHNTEYDVYDIEGKEHGGYNDTPKTWWVYYSERLPEGLFPPIDSTEWEPYGIGINRRLWDIRIKQSNSSKYKWDECNFSNHTSVEMWCNGKLVYAFGTTGNDSGIAYAMAKVQYMKVMLSEHCYNFFEPEKENGRKIWWYGLPATIKLKHQPWEIAIIPCYESGLSRDEWWQELKRRESKFNEPDSEDKQMDDDYFEETKRDNYINWGDAFEDRHIDWFRK